MCIDDLIINLAMLDEADLALESDAHLQLLRALLVQVTGSANNVIRKRYLDSQQEKPASDGCPSISIGGGRQHGAFEAFCSVEM